MTALLVCLALAQAALLLGAAVQLSDAFLRPNKIAKTVWCFAALGAALGIAQFGTRADPHRALCSLGDCAVLAATVACVRYLAVTREEERLAVERELAARAAAEAAEAARKARAAERVRAATAALESRQARPAEALAATVTARQHTPSVLSGARPRPPTAART